MALGRRFTELTRLDVTDVISSVVEAFANRSAHGLEQSQHAPRKETYDGLSQQFSHVRFHLLLFSGDSYS